jgi:transcriptional regulator with XRE-family HTH domain
MRETSTRSRTPRTFGDFLRSEREARSWSRDYVAGRLRYARSALEMLEANKTKPSVETLAQLGVLFEWDFNRVMTWFGAREARGVSRIANEIGIRPLLLEVFDTARQLDSNQLEFVRTFCQALVAKGHGHAPRPGKRTA